MNKVFLICLVLALVVDAKPQFDLIKKATEQITGALDGCKGKESEFSSKPGLFVNEIIFDFFLLDFC